MSWKASWKSRKPWSQVLQGGERWERVGTLCFSSVSKCSALLSGEQGDKLRRGCWWWGWVAVPLREK